MRIARGLFLFAIGLVALAHFWPMGTYVIEYTSGYCDFAGGPLLLTEWVNGFRDVLDPHANSGARLTSMMRFGLAVGAAFLLLGTPLLAGFLAKAPPLKWLFRILSLFAFVWLVTAGAHHAMVRSEGIDGARLVPRAGYWLLLAGVVCHTAGLFMLPERKQVA